MAKKEKKEKESKKDKEAFKTSLEVLPIRNYDDDINAFQLSDGTYMDIFEIEQRDRNNLQGDAVQFDVYALARFERLYAGDHKDIALTFPNNTAVQRANLIHKLNNTVDPVRKKWLTYKINEMAWTDNNVMRKEFYRIIYGENKEKIVKNRTNVLSWLGYGRSRLLREIPKEKKIQVLRKMCNMNSLIAEKEPEGDVQYE